MVRELQLDPGLAGSLVSAHCLTIAIFSPLLGILADRIGRLRVLIPSLILYAIFGAVGALMTDFWPLLVTRGLLGAASGGIAAASLGLLGSMYEGKERSQALGLATSTLTITGITDPLLGGLVGATRWQNAFYLYGLGIPLAILVGLVFKKERPLKARAIATNSSHELWHILKKRQTLRLLLGLALTSVAMYAVVIYAPFYLEKAIKADTLLNGIILASRAIGAAAIAALGTSKLVHLMGLVPAIGLGFGIMGVTLATIPLLHQLHWILLAAILFGLGFGIVLPSLYNALANFAPSELRSSILAAGTGVGFLGQFLSPVLLGPILHYGSLESVFYAAAGVAVIAGLLQLTPLREGEREEEREKARVGKGEEKSKVKSQKSKVKTNDH
jgi:predicted MFS family arabinose efflux permease